jgi:type II secretory pathway pseudopilin PulG
LRGTSQRGVSLVEVLIGILIVVIASIGTLTYFAYGLGGIGKQGNRRAALERARERLEQLMAANIDNIKPPAGDENVYWVSCDGACTRGGVVGVDGNPSNPVSVDDLPSQPIEATVQWKNDPSAGTDTLDTLELGVKVWFMPNSTVDDDFHRVHIRTLRTP